MNVLLFILCFVKQVSADGGALALDKVFALIAEGEDLPVSCEKELKVNKHLHNPSSYLHFYLSYV